MLTLLLFICAILLSAISIFRNTSNNTNTGNSNRKSNLKLPPPPGPKAWPLFGNLVHLIFQSTDPNLALVRLAKKYGRVCGIWFGNTRYLVVISSLPIMQEICSNPFTSSRCSFSSQNGTKNVNDGHQGKWQDLRRLFTRTMQDFVDFLMQQEITTILDGMNESQSQQTEIVGSKTFMASVVKILVAFVAGPHSKDNTRGKIINEIIEQIISVNTGKFKWKDAFPNKSGKSKGENGSLQGTLKALVNEVKSGMEEEEYHQARGFIGDVLDEMKWKDGCFTEDQLLELLRDLFIHGVPHTSNLIYWMLYSLSQNPEVQEKIYAEIEAEFESLCDSLLESEDRLSYTKAVVQEVLRSAHYPPLLTPGPRRVLKDLNLKGFSIPKRAELIFNTEPMLKDEIFWGKARTFDPQRFMQEDMEERNLRNEKVSGVFGFGNRCCLGEYFVRSFLFLYLTTIVRSYKISATIKGSDLPNSSISNTDEIQNYPLKLILRANMTSDK